ncbi:MAG: hypothetical protein ACT4NU_10310 [Chromatiales bacterium]
MSGRVGLDSSQAELCRHFLDWQCRLRRYAMRREQGRPSPGMRPTVLLPEDTQLGPITVLITRREPEATTAQFRFMASKTHDPAERYANALRLLQAEYYQHADEFSDLITALFSLDSRSCRSMAEAARCTLRFEEGEQLFSLGCAVRSLEEEHAAFQATYWHNVLFNRGLPGRVEILGFLPDWAAASAEPGI